MVRRGKKIRIRCLKESDAESLFSNYCGDLEAAKYISSHPHQSPDETRIKIRRWVQYYSEPAPSVLVFGITPIKGDAVIGVLVLVLNKNFGEIHFGSSNQYGGRGFATEACQIGLKYLKELGAIEVRTQPYHQHTASIRVLEKCGFKHHGTLQKHAKFPTLGDGLFDCADMRLNFSDLHNQ